MAKQPNHASQPTKFRTSIGGQALIEGILMRGPEKQAVVVRKPDGDLEIKVDELHLIRERHPFLGIPLIRGTVNFLDSLVKGIQALTYSASFYPEEEDENTEPSKFEVWLEKTLGSERFTQLLIAFAMIVGIGFSVFLFILLPAFVGGLLQKVISSYLICNLLEGVLRILIFLLYLILCSKQKDIKRVFSYHGAEHKTIFCYERGLDLTVEHVRDMPRHHPRCGTSFLFVILVLSILLFSVVQVQSILLQMGIKLLLLPVLVSIAYEINRYVGRHDTALTRVITAPGLWLQNFTTNEPDDSMIEVGIASLKAVLPNRKGQDAW
jgi:uncharacterized protein YqhQ